VVRANSAPIPQLLTPEQQTVLRNTMKAEQLSQRGKQRSAGANARAVLHLNHLMSPESPLKQLSYDAKVKLVASIEHTQPHVIRELHVRAAAGESLAPVDVVRLSRDDPEHRLFGTFGPSLSVETFLYTHIQEAQEENYYTSVSSLQAAIKIATDEEIASTTLKDWLKKLGIRYGKKKLTGLKHKYADALTRKYIYEYAELLRREKKGEIILVWMDESYIHAGYCASRGKGRRCVSFWTTPNITMPGERIGILLGI
jgi:hypothetical protein